MAQPKKPNQIARVLAVFALVGAFILVIATVATSGGSDDEGDATEKTEQTGLTPKGERAVDAGVWIVEEGDTLVAISEQTGIDLDELVELNPDIDPQALVTGQRISLRAGQAGEEDSSSSSSSTTTTGGDPADEFGDGSVANDDSGSGDSTSP